MLVEFQVNSRRSGLCLLSLAPVLSQEKGRLRIRPDPNSRNRADPNHCWRYGPLGRLLYAGADFRKVSDTEIAGEKSNICLVCSVPVCARAHETGR